MKYLFLEVWILLLLAFVLGWLAHWFFSWRQNSKASGDAGPVVVTGTAATPVGPAKLDNDWQPPGFTDRPAQTDDLKRIKGVGPVIEQTLHELGVYRFYQVANWTPENIRWVEDRIDFPGRISREQWTVQARTLRRNDADHDDRGEVKCD